MHTQRLYVEWHGAWRMIRQICDTRSNAVLAKVSGSALFLWRGTQTDLHYQERGQLCRPDNTSVAVRRQYLYQYRDKTISAYFIAASNALLPFHTLEFSTPHHIPEESSSPNQCTWEATGLHLCGLDRYAVHYRFWTASNALQHMAIAYTVTGPHKNFRVVTHYGRMPLFKHKTQTLVRMSG